MKAATLWLTGLSGSGKSTVADALVERLRAGGLPVELLDGDVVRSVFPATGFSKEERDRHVKRIGFLASRLERHGVFVVCSFISPYRESRAWVREQCGNFVEIHVATSLEECERRDVKGLYARARSGEIEHFTGIDDPYEAPEDPEIRIETTDLTVEQTVDRIVARLETQEGGDAS